MLFIGFYYILKSKDNQCQINNSDDINTVDITHIQSIKSIKTKKLILIRHGESIWNEIFNKQIFTISFPFRLIKILLKEIIYLFISKDSYLFDSPLSYIGIQQCNNLRTFLCTNKSETIALNINQKTSETMQLNTTNCEIISECINILNNINCKSIIVSSPLRRCIETISLSLYDRLNNNINSNDKIYLLSTLQELTRNIDGLSLSINNKELPPISKYFKSIHRIDNNNNKIEWKQWFNKKIDISMKDGVKSKYKRGDDRINQFVKWIFIEKNKYDNIIVSGHSIWCKMFFKSFLPANVGHNAKKYKIQNGGVVTLELTQYIFKNGKVKYMIHPESIHTVFKGFEIEKHNYNKKI